MQALFGSELETLVLRFRDYIRAKYAYELSIWKIKNEQTTEFVIGANPAHPLFTQIQQQAIQYLQEPWSERYTQASWQLGETQLPSKQGASWKSLHWGKYIQLVFQHGLFTLVITLICLILYIWGLFGGQEFIMNWAHYPAESAQDIQLWRYWSHSVVHLSHFHILSNLLWWWIFGGMIESQLGSSKLTLLYIISAFVTGIAQNFMSGYTFFGLSGVVYAVLGYVFVRSRFSLQTGFALPAGFFMMLIVSILSGFLSPLIGIEMGNTAHISGLITGGILAAVDIYSSKTTV